MSEENPNAEDKRFAVLSKKSVRMYGEATGHSTVSDDVANLLSEDVMYRVREATNNSLKFMKHARRRRLTVDDFNKALKYSDVGPVLGHRHCDGQQFRQTKEGELQIYEDQDVSLPDVALSTSHVPQNPGQTTVKAHWLAVEGIQKGSSLSQNVDNKGLSADLTLYYDNITKIILGVDEELMKLALIDVRTNGKIMPLLPKFVLFISNGVKLLNNNVKQLTKLLHTVRSLVNNTSLYLELRPYLNLLVQGVIYCLSEPLSTSNDHWALRDYAARLLAQVVKDWGNSVNQLKSQTVHMLKKVFHDSTKPFCCHYGAIMGLIAVGTQAVEDVVLPQLWTYWPHLQTVMEDISYANAQLKSDSHKVYGALLLAAELVIKSKYDQMTLENKVKNVQKRCADSGNEHEGPSYNIQVSSHAHHHNKHETNSVTSGDSFSLPLGNSSDKSSLAVLYEQLQEYFGDALSNQLPFVHFSCMLPPKPKKKPKVKQEFVTLTDPVLQKSGEDLLNIILSAPSPVPPKIEIYDDASSSIKSSVSEEGEHSDERSDLHSEHSADADVNQPAQVDYYAFPNDEMEPDDVKSEKSERSFKSDKSENSFNEEEIQVKTVKEDPNQGIKLTIKFGKRQKGKSLNESDTGSQSGESVVALEPPELSHMEKGSVDKMDTLQNTPKRGRKRKQSTPVYATEEHVKKPMFECVPMQTKETSLVLKIKGPHSSGHGSGVSTGEKTEPRRRTLLCSDSSDDDDTPLNELNAKMWK